MKRRDFIIGSGVGMIGASFSTRGAAQALPCPPWTVRAAGSGPVQTPCGQPTVTPTWLQGAAVNQWVALPSLSSSSVLPNPPAPGNVSAVTDAWGGGALRPTGSYYILHGGGHGDYGGNEIYALQLSANSPQWERVWGPTPNAQITQGTHYYADGNPCSIHTYRFLQYCNQTDTLMRFAQSYYVAPSGMYAGVDGWQWGAANWLPAGTFAAQPLGDFGAYGAGVALDSNGNCYMISNYYQRLIWTRSTNTWSLALNSTYGLQYNVSVYDSARNFIWSFGGGLSAGTALKWNISANTETLVTVTGPAASAIYSATGGLYMGAAYDPIIDKVFIYDGSGTLYQFDTATLIATTVTTTGSTPASDIPTGNSNTNPWGKFQYVPALGGVVIQPMWKAATVFLRTH